MHNQKQVDAKSGSPQQKAVNTASHGDDFPFTFDNAGKNKASRIRHFFWDLSNREMPHKYITALAANPYKTAGISACLAIWTALFFPAPTVSVFMAAVFGFLIWLFAANHIQNQDERIQELSNALESEEDRIWELREREERYRFLSEVFGDLVIHRDDQKNVRFVNEAFVKTFDLDRDAIIGQQLPFKMPIVPSPDKSVKTLTSNLVREVCLKTPKGERWFWWLDFPFRDDANDRTSVRSVARDITEHKKSELALIDASQKANAASEAKSRFLANVSHEMRTPLNGILGMSDLLSDSKLTPEQKTYNEAVRTSGNALLGLIEDILDLTKIEAGRFELRKENFSLASLVEETCELLSLRAHTKGVTLSSHCDQRVPAKIMSDEGRLRQVLINLIGNAVKFTAKGEVSLRVTLEKSNTQNQHLLKFEVQDTGPGMTEDEMNLIFGEFEQADAGKTREHGGAGLGLSISQAIIHSMGSKITVESELGVGSTFAFEITVEEAEAKSDDKLEISNDIAPDALAGSNVLIISHDPLETENIAMDVREFGGKVQTVATIANAEKLLKKSSSSFTHVLFDRSATKLPDKTVKRLSKVAGSNPQFIIMLKPELRSELDGYLKAGFQSYLIKPLRRLSLVRVIKKKTPQAARDENCVTIEDRRNTEPSVVEVESPPLMDDRIMDQPAAVEHLPELGTSLNILLAEDNAINALLAKSVLTKAGHSVEHFENGKLALNAWKKSIKSKKSYDLALFDLHMPVMDGLAAVAKLREIEATQKLKHLPIMILTADEQAETKNAALEQGADGFVTKPLVPARLLEMTRDLV